MSHKHRSSYKWGMLFTAGLAHVQGVCPSPATKPFPLDPFSFLVPGLITCDVCTRRHTETPTTARMVVPREVFA